MTEIKNKTRRDTVKAVANFTVKYSISWTVGNMIGNTTNPTNARNKAQVLVTAVVLAHMISTLSEPFVNEKIDYLADEYTKFRSELKKATADN